MSDPLRLGIAGLGTVGVGVVKIIRQQAAMLNRGPQRICAVGLGEGAQIVEVLVAEGFGRFVEQVELELEGGANGETHLAGAVDLAQKLISRA